MPNNEAAPLNWSSVFRPLGEKISGQLANAVGELRLEEAAQRRYDELAEKNTEGTLSEDERIELAEFVTLNRMVGIIKAEATLTLRGKVAA